VLDTPFFTVLDTPYFTVLDTPYFTVLETPLVDVSSHESASGGPELTLAAHPKSGQIVLLEMSHRDDLVLTKNTLPASDRNPDSHILHIFFLISLYWIMGHILNWCLYLSVADPGSGALLTPGSGIGLRDG
jgi:hypothetical protein